MMKFALTDLLDEKACYEYLVQALHPAGLACPHGHPLPLDQAPHSRHRVPVVKYKCRQCGSVYNLFTGTILTKTRWRCSVIVQLLHAIVAGTPTLHLAQELGVDRKHLARRRHQMQALLAGNFPLPTAGSRG